jgi:hypothetical protein
MKGFRDAALASALNLALLIGFVCLVVWWIQTNFGALSALATVGGVLGALLLYVGIRTGGNLVRDANRTSLENFVDGLASVEQTRTAVARGQNAVQVAQAKIAVIDYQQQVRQQQLAQQQIHKALTDALGQSPQPQTVQAWAMDDDDASEGVRYYE